MAAVLGMIGSAIIICNFMLFLSRRINRRFYNNKNSMLQQISGGLRLPHPFLGAAALLAGIMHGYLMGGFIQFHTGTFILAVLAVMGLAAAIGRRFRIRDWIKAHRTGAAFLAILLLFHFLSTKGFLDF